MRHEQLQGAALVFGEARLALHPVQGQEGHEIEFGQQSDSAQTTGDAKARHERGQTGGCIQLFAAKIHASSWLGHGGIGHRVLFFDLVPQARVERGQAVRQ